MQFISIICIKADDDKSKVLEAEHLVCCNVVEHSK